MKESFLSCPLSICCFSAPEITHYDGNTVTETFLKIKIIMEIVKKEAAMSLGNFTNFVSGNEVSVEKI
jgi:hypothetical protein